MIKQEMLNSIISMVQEMGPTLKLARTGLYISQDSGKLKSEYIRPAYNWILGIYGKEFLKARNVRALCKEEVWEMCELRGEKNFREVIMLRESLAALKRAITNNDKPVFFRRNEIERILKSARKGHHSKSPADGQPGTTNESPISDSGETH